MPTTPTKTSMKEAEQLVKETFPSDGLNRNDLIAKIAALLDKAYAEGMECQRLTTRLESIQRKN